MSSPEAREAKASVIGSLSCCTPSRTSSSSMAHFHTSTLSYALTLSSVTGDAGMGSDPYHSGRQSAVRARLPGDPGPMEGSLGGRGRIRAVPGKASEVLPMTVV